MGQPFRRKRTNSYYFKDASGKMIPSRKGQSRSLRPIAWKFKLMKCSGLQLVTRVVRSEYLEVT